MPPAHQSFRFSLPVVLLAAVLLLSSCSKYKNEFENPYEHSDVALDPADDANWPANWQSSSRADSIFAAFVRQAQANSHWILLGHKGEAVYVRPGDPLKMSVRYQGGSNKVEKMRIIGPFQAISMRQYARGENLTYDAQNDNLSMGASEIRHNRTYSHLVPQQ